MGARRLQPGGGVVEGLAFLADHVLRPGRGSCRRRARRSSSRNSRSWGSARRCSPAAARRASSRRRTCERPRWRLPAGASDVRAMTMMKSAPSAKVHQYLLPLITQLVAVPPGPAGDVGDVGSGVGLRHREGAEELALGHARQITAALFLAHHVRADQQIAAGDQRGDAHPAARQLLGHQAVLEAAQAQAAVLLRDQDAEVAELGHLVAQLHRDVALLGVELVGDGQHLVEREVARLLLDHAALFGDVRHLMGS